MKNVSREFATMDEDERRRFAMEKGEESGDPPHELELAGDPRIAENMGGGEGEPDDGKIRDRSKANDGR